MARMGKLCEEMDAAGDGKIFAKRRREVAVDIGCVRLLWT